MLQVALEAADFVVATGSLHDFRTGTKDLFAFLDDTRPDVILYDLSPPYEANWAFIQRAQQRPTFARCGLVITTTNKRAVEKLVSLPVVEIFGKPYDLDVLTTAVRTATAPPSTVESDEDRRRRDRRTGDDRKSGNDRRDGGPVE